jgi:hypothetical protein
MKAEQDGYRHEARSSPEMHVLSFQSGQTTNQTRVSKPLWEGLATTFHARNHRTATGSSREGAKSAMPKKSKNAEPSFPTVDTFKEQVI